MNADTFGHLGEIIAFRFPDAENAREYEVERWKDEITLIHWDEEKMGQPRPDGETMLQWIEEYKVVSDYEKMPQHRRDNDDLRQTLRDLPLVQSMMTATPQQISSQVDAANTQQLRNIIKVLILAVRMLVRESL